MGDTAQLECPVCMKFYPQLNFELHVDRCLHNSNSGDTSADNPSQSTMFKSRLNAICDDLANLVEDLKGASPEIVTELRQSCERFQSVVDKSRSDLGILFGKRKREASDHNDETGSTVLAERSGSKSSSSSHFSSSSVPGPSISFESSSSSTSASMASLSFTDDSPSKPATNSTSRKSKGKKTKKERRSRDRNGKQEKKEILLEEDQPKSGKQEKKESKSQISSFSSSSSSSSSSGFYPVGRDEELAALLDQEEKDELKRKNVSDDASSAELVRQMLSCTVCKQFKGETTDNVLDCDHILCDLCLKKRLAEILEKGHCQLRDLQCPVMGCSSTLPTRTYKKVLSAKEIASLEDIQMKGFLEKEDRFTCCPNSKCGEGFEMVNGTVDVAGGGADDDGKPLSHEAKEHRAKNRFRCPSCSTVFCKSCKSNPYHLGYTCKQYRQYEEAVKCRFCTTALTTSNTASPGPVSDVCTEEECRDKRDAVCTKKLACGHPCGGVRNEKKCLPCLRPECQGEDANQSADDYCSICGGEKLQEAPSIQLKCKHIFHSKCVAAKLEKKWPGARIHFGFLECPLCKKDISHPSLNKITGPLVKLKKKVSEKALEQLSLEHMENDPKLVNPDGKYYQKPQAFALDRFAFYPCAKCKLPYFGGMRKCEEAGAPSDEKYNPEHLVCGSCCAGANVKSCAVEAHKKQYIEYKCKFCCNLASWFCWGNTHFCDHCHKRQENGDYVSRKKQHELPKCPGPQKCVLGIEHPPNGEEFALGCSLCRPRIARARED
eukprot:gb/GEZN01001877.1/.p1 GENE.gb/GEZN01001877.1/~~gb/GEZN01001877.1/.p1  ORF type:complete len:775 (-),score=116.06 gb/GEZN01001877.1/:289-2613(-)